MFKVQVRKVNEATVGRWVSIWESADGDDCAEYLASCVMNGDPSKTEYRMVYVTKIFEEYSA